MADIRINAIATTATDFASDDYIAIDGTANGTRKVNAKTANLTFGDVRFGTSGPSAKSSIAARAARQGLVGNGTAESTATLTSALGSTDKSFAVTVLVNEAGNGIFHFGTSNSTVARQLQLALLTTRKLRVELLGATTGDIRQANTDSAIADNGKFAHVVCTISGSTLTIYVNGVSVSYTEVTAGTPPAWSDTVNGTAVEFGGAAGTSFASTALETPYVYNRALTAAEVVSLYEAGVPSGADYNSASNTLLNTSTALNTFSTSFTTFTGASATGFTGSDTTASKTIRVQFPLSGTLVSGRRYRIKGTATLTAMGTVQLYQSDAAYTGVGSIGSLAAGAFEFTFTAVSAVSSIMLICPTDGTAGTHTLVISGFAVDTPGLLLAPDAAQAGGGLTWYDTSGNAANITLPASGVTWNVPTSGNVTSGGALNLRAGGTNQNITFTPSGTGVHFFNGFNATAGTPGTYTVRLGNGSSDYVGLSFDGTYGYLQTWGGRPLYLNSQGNNIVTGSGNVLIGTTTDGGQKLQVAGAGIVKGSFFSARSDNTGSIQLIPTSGVSAGSDIESFNGSTSAYARLNTRGTHLQVYTGTSANTLALTVDDSQRTILSGALRLNNAYTAGAPTATGYVTLQDSAGNTYKVLVGT